MTLRLSLPGGTLKIKRQDELRRREQKKLVPVWKVGKYYVIWWPDGVPDGPSPRSTKEERTRDEA